MTWISRAGNAWCELDNVDLSGLDTVGVFVIWYAGDPGRVVCIGQGDVATRLRALRSSETLQPYRSNGDLLVTWAKVSPARVDGIERYLTETWTPLIANAAAEAEAIEVNSPGWIRPFV